MLTTSKMLNDLIDTKSETNIKQIDINTLYHQMSIAIKSNKIFSPHGDIILHLNENNSIVFTLYKREHWRITCWFMNIIIDLQKRYIENKRDNRSKWCYDHKISCKNDEVSIKLAKRYKKLLRLKNKFRYF